MITGLPPARRPCGVCPSCNGRHLPRAARPRLGGISFLHRFGSALNHHVHLHACVTDGVFVPAAVPDMLAWENSGFSVDASVRITLLDRDVPGYFRSLEHLLRYCARPPFALERLSVRRGAGGRIARVRYVLPRHNAANWLGPGSGRKSTRPGASGVAGLTPFEFLDRLADLVPPPRKHRHRYHGVFALNHKLRPAVTALAIGNIVAFITEPGPIRKILAHLGEPLERPPLSPARGPPTSAFNLRQRIRDGVGDRKTWLKTLLRHEANLTRLNRKAGHRRDSLQFTSERLAQPIPNGNTGGSSSFFAGSWADYLTANPGATPASALGAYGTDLNTRTVWAVVNHNSDFAAVVVPEPSSAASATSSSSSRSEAAPPSRPQTRVYSVP